MLQLSARDLTIYLGGLVVVLALILVSLLGKGAAPTAAPAVPTAHVGAPAAPTAAPTEPPTAAPAAPTAAPTEPPPVAPALFAIDCSNPAPEDVAACENTGVRDGR